MSRANLAKIEEQLAERAKDFQKTVQAPQGRKIVIDNKTGNIIAPGDINLGQEVRLIVVDFCSANRFYPGKYDPSNVVPPVCFSFDRVIDDMAPEEEAPEPQHENCKKCPHNQWGSNGRGKACKNTRELAVVLADELEDPDYEPELFHVSIAPASIKHFDAAVTQIHNLFDSHIIKAIVTMRATPVKDYFEAKFSNFVANPYLERVFDLMDEAPDLIAKTPDLTNYTPTPKPRGR